MVDLNIIKMDKDKKGVYPARICLLLHHHHSVYRCDVPQAPWMLGKRFGYVTPPGEMVADYFKGDGVRVLTVVVALFHSISWCTVKEPQGFYLMY